MRNLYNMERCNREGKESFMPNLTPEQEAREKIDQMLVDASWIVQNNADLNLGAGPGVAVG